MDSPEEYTYNFILSKIEKAIEDYNLIEENDKILIAVSGGKDSLTLLKFLKEIQKSSKMKYEIFAAHIKTDFVCSGCVHINILEKIFKEMNIQYVFREINVLDKDKKTNCFWCAWNRRRTLFEIAVSLNCNKVALGHHKDDIIETTLLNLFFHGEFSSMNPRQELFKGKITIIRPLCYVEENITEKFAKANNFPSQICKCPYSQYSNRKYMKTLIKTIQKGSPDVKTNIFRSIERIKYENLH